MLKVPFGRLSEPQRLDCLNWPAWPYKPSVEFHIGYDEGGIRLEWKVDEQTIRALQGTSGCDVYEDSCVEFFFQPSADDPHYYNFEWNAIGNLCVSWRTGRFDPEPAPAAIYGLVKAEASCGDVPFAERPADGPWTLKLYIPLEALWKNGVTSLKGLKARGNFYKCGDGLTVPHFVTWGPIVTEKPDYHRPEFFKEIVFE
ncbi:MAG: hypothetical protein IKZ60_04650 [Bacteroidales bacterium]|nr:hypothetical protein [Bacteroidales bacterium]